MRERVRQLNSRALLWLAVLSGCAPPATPASPPPSGPDALWTALAAWAAGLEADPARIRVHPVLGPPEPDPFSPRPAPVAPADSAAIRTLARLGVQTSDAVEDLRCLWARGVPDPGSENVPVADRCRAMDRYRTVVFSRVWTASDGEHVRAFVLRNYGFEVFDLRLERAGAGWKVLGVSRVFGIMS
jgi:hypothetical protein